MRWKFDTWMPKHRISGPGVRYGNSAQRVKGSDMHHTLKEADSGGEKATTPFAHARHRTKPICQRPDSMIKESHIE